MEGCKLEMMDSTIFSAYLIAEGRARREEVNTVVTGYNEKSWGRGDGTINKSSTHLPLPYHSLLSMFSFVMMMMMMMMMMMSRAACLSSRRTHPYVQFPP